MLYWEAIGTPGIFCWYMAAAHVSAMWVCESAATQPRVQLLAVCTALGVLWVWGLCSALSCPAARSLHCCQGLLCLFPAGKAKTDFFGHSLALGWCSSFPSSALAHLAFITKRVLFPWLCVDIKIVLASFKGRSLLLQKLFFVVCFFFF